MGFGQYDSLGEYCGPHAASFVFLRLISLSNENNVTSGINESKIYFKMHETSFPACPHYHKVPCLHFDPTWISSRIDARISVRISQFEP